MTKDFNYYLTGTGWAEVFFNRDNQNIRFGISHLSDPLPDLFEGLCRLIKNQSNFEKVVFAEEPGEHSLVISKEGKDTIQIEIFWNDEWEKIDQDSQISGKKELVYSDIDTLTNFTLVICTGINNLLERLTVSEYKEKWSLSEFPIDSYKQLQQLLN